MKEAAWQDYLKTDQSTENLIEYTKNIQEIDDL